MGRDFRKNKAFEAAHCLVMQVYDATKSFPREETYGLTSQTKRAAISVAANIVEGAARQYNKEYVQFLYHSMGSLTELEYYLFLSSELGYLQRSAYEAVEASRKDAGRIISGLLRSLRNQSAPQ